MSGALSYVYNNIGYALNLHAEAMFRLQEQASTGSRINRPSDDPSAAYRVLGLNSQERSFGNYVDNISQAVSTLEISSLVLENMISTFADTKVELTQITSGTYSPEQRKSAADGINETLEKIVSWANTEHSNRYLFGGSDTDSKPYKVKRTAGEIVSVTYQGSYQGLDVEVASGVESNAFYVGDEIFRSDDRSTPIFLGSTGAKAGTGTSSVRGDVWLKVTGSPGDYDLSIDGGTSWVDAGGNNVAVRHSVTKEVLYVNTTAISSTGTDMVRVEGTYDIFNTLIGLRDILENEKELPEAQLVLLREGALESLEEIRNLLVQKSASIGSKIGFLSDLKDTLENMQFGTEDEITSVQEADIAQVAIDMSRRQVLYEMSLSVAARLMSMSLLDFLK